MTRRIEDMLSAAILGSAAALAAAALLWWLEEPGARVVVTPRVGTPPVELDKSAVDAGVEIKGSLQRFDGTAADLDGTWPRFRGASFDNISRRAWAGPASWPGDCPRELWRVELGEGHAGAAVANGRVYVLDYDEEARADSLRCFSLEDGAEIWRRSYQVDVKRNHGMSRTVPAVGRGVVVSIGPKCHVLAADAANGDFLWGLDLVRDFAAEVPLWYTAQCPLLDGGVAVLAPAGSVLMLGVDAATGERVWECPNPGGLAMSHASVIPMTIDGTRMYVYCAVGGVVGVAADPPERGTLLWTLREWDHTVVAPSPVHLGDGRIFVTAGYGAGSMVFRVRRADDGFAVEVEAAIDRSVFACEQQTPVWYGGRLYGVLPNDAGERKQQLVCWDPAEGIVWASGKDHRFGLGPFMVVDGRLLVLDDRGTLTVAEAQAGEFRPLAACSVLSGRDAWGPMAVAADRLLVRDSRTMVCLELQAARARR